MSLQDDYFDLDAFLKKRSDKNITPEIRKSMRRSFQRIWTYLIELENEVDDLREFRGSFRNMLRLIQKTEETN